MKTLKPIPMTEVLATFGTKTDFAKALGITHGAVCHWGDFVCNSRTYQVRYLLNEINQTAQPTGALS